MFLGVTEPPEDTGVLLGCSFSVARALCGGAVLTPLGHLNTIGTETCCLYRAHAFHLPLNLRLT